MIKVVIAALLTCGTLGIALAHDDGHGGTISPEELAWYANLKQPDNPGMSCCGLADAYYADSFKASKDGNYIAIITDTREDQQFGRPHVPPGTEVIVPNNKLKYDQGNPTGHGVIFMSRVPNDGDGQPSVYCYVVPGGV